MMVLHGSGGSPYVTRVLMQAAAKNLNLELRPANLADPEFRRMNPIGKMPVLEHDGFVLPESYVICEYLEDVFPTPSLRGASAHDRARVRLIARVVDLYCAGIFPILRAAADPTFTIEASERATLDMGLDALDTFLSGDGWAVGGCHVARRLRPCDLALLRQQANAGRRRRADEAPEARSLCRLRFRPAACPEGTGGNGRGLPGVHGALEGRAGRHEREHLTRATSRQDAPARLR